jgi:hypothetical protein
MGRPRIYENAAARQAAYLARNARVEIVMTKAQHHAVEQLAIRMNVKLNELCLQALMLGLTNRNWLLQGLIKPEEK